LIISLLFCDVYLGPDNFLFKDDNGVVAV